MSRLAERIIGIDPPGTFRSDRYQNRGIPQLAYRPRYLVRLSQSGKYKSPITVAILGLISDPLLERNDSARYLIFSSDCPTSPSMLGDAPFEPGVLLEGCVCLF